MTKAPWSGIARIERGERVVEFVSGERRTGAPVSAESLFQAGSVGKTVVAVVVLRLAERGDVDLFSPIGAYLTDLPSDKQRLTLHQLLSHTSGLGHWPDMPYVDMADPPVGDVLFSLVRDQAIPHPSGDWRYSNFGYLLASRVVGQVTGEPYAAVAERTVLEPAGMSHSRVGSFPEEDRDFAVGHRDGEELVTSPTPSSIPGTGDLWTTATDLIAFSRAVHSGELLRSSSLEAMTTPHATFPPMSIGDPRILASAYGYGCWLGTVRGERAIILPGDNDGYRSLLAYSRESGAHLAVLTNDDGPTLQGPLDLLFSDAG